MKALQRNLRKGVKVRLLSIWVTSRKFKISWNISYVCVYIIYIYIAMMSVCVYVYIYILYIYMYYIYVCVCLLDLLKNDKASICPLAQEPFHCTDKLHHHLHKWTQARLPVDPLGFQWNVRCFCLDHRLRPKMPPRSPSQHHNSRINALLFILSHCLHIIYIYR